MSQQVVLIGAGMIAHDQLLPSLYQLQRLGRIGDLTVVAQRRQSVEALAANEAIRRAFPGHIFQALPIMAGRHPKVYEEALARLPARQIAVVAVPDHLHHEVILAALRANQHVLAVKPLVLTAAHAEEIGQEAAARGLMVGIEYHKRFDDRSLLARRRYREGWFGEFKLGTACLMEKWYYRHSNFQNWCTTENSDPFVYIGCHYVDLVHFITGLQPVAVSVYGIKDKYPNGNEGWLWSDARVIWNNGACLNVQNSLSFPDDAPGSNTQGLTMHCSGGDRGAWIEHSDQYRGLRYSYVARPEIPGGTVFAEPSTDYFQYVETGESGLRPVGYGYRSIEAIVEAIRRVEAAPEADRPRMLAEIDAAGLIATPRNSRYNEAVIEAARLSIAAGGQTVAVQSTAG